MIIDSRLRTPRAINDQFTRDQRRWRRQSRWVLLRSLLFLAVVAAAVAYTWWLYR